MDKNTAALTQLQPFRKNLYVLLPRRRNALINLLDALCSSPNARSVVELSLSLLFESTYSSLTDAIENLFQTSSSEQARTERWAWQQSLTRLIRRYLPPPTQNNNFYAKKIVLGTVSLSKVPKKGSQLTLDNA